MTPEQIEALAPGDTIRWHSHLDSHIDGRVLSVSTNGAYIDWEDARTSFVPRTRLAWATFALQTTSDPEADHQ